MQKTAVVTGSARRLGKAILLALAENGYNVIVHYNKSRKAALQTVSEAKEFGVKAIAVKADLCNEKDVRLLFKKISKKFWKIDVLVNNVGNFAVKKFSEYSLAEWNYLVQTTAGSTFVCCKHALPVMKKSGRIVNIGDSSADKIAGQQRILPYNIGKVGVHIITKTLALELAEKGITVNMVSPGIMFNTVSFPLGGLKNVPAKRWTKFEDVVNAVLFLIKPESNYITGANITATGGYKL